MKQAENKFIVVTDMREAVGVEEIVGRKVVVAVDHIVKIEAVEEHIAEHLNYSATIHFVNSNWAIVRETQEEIISKIYAN
jgi:uncharacterized protein YlzI (FlbEa/FlbD family)